MAGEPADPWLGKLLGGSAPVPGSGAAPAAAPAYTGTDAVDVNPVLRQKLGLTPEGLPQAYGPPAPPEEQPFPGTPGNLDANQEAVNSILSGMALDNALAPAGPTGGPKAFYAPGHEEYTQLGGREGKSLFQEAYGTGPDDGPKKLQAAVRASDVAQGDRADAMAKFYEGEAQRATQTAAARKMAMQQDQAELQARRAKLEQATQFYTDDLADRGQFWANPGNILAAISFSLMPIFSNDPTVGVKLINQAIQQDLDNRRANAQGTLGALRSNLDGYRQLVGDRQAGDQLAEAEARRVAATEVERIAAKFESPISKARAEAAIQSLRMQAAQGYMQAYSQGHIYTPAQKADPNVYAMRTQGFDGAFSPINSEEKSSQGVGAGTNSLLKGGSPSVAESGKGFDGRVAPVDKALVKAGASVDTIAKKALAGRFPGSENALAAYEASVNRMATNMANGQASGPAFNKARQVILNEADAEVQKVAPTLFPIAGKIATLKNLQTDAEIMRVAAQARGQDPQKFLGYMRNIWGNGIPDRYEGLVRAFSGSPKGPSDPKAVDQEIKYFRQRFGAQLAEQYNQISGGVINPDELPRLKAIISSEADLGLIENWMKEKSVGLQGQYMAAMPSSAIAKLRYLTTQGSGSILHAPGLARKPFAGPGK